MKSTILISNSFPFSLIRRKVVVEPATVGDLITAMSERPWVSTWGHNNTVGLASTIVGADLRPSTERPALHLTEENFPAFDRDVFDVCWVLSPDYAAPGFRPKVGEEIAPAAIKGWQVLRMLW